VSKRVSNFPVVRVKPWPRIVDYRKSKLRSFMVDGRRRGNGRRYYFRNLTDARICADQLAISRENHGTALLNFPAADLVMAVEVRELLAPFGKTIRDAASHYVAHLEAEAIKSTSPPIRDCAAQFLTSRLRDVGRGELAARTVAELRQTMNHLVAACGNLPVSDLDVEAVRRFLDSFPVTARTRNNLRLRLSALLSFCKSKRWIATNPCAEIQIKVRRNSVVVLTVDEVERLLRCAEASRFRDVLVPYVVLCVFGGLRPFECQGLDWRNVNFQTQHIHVLAHTSKKREARFVQMEPTLNRWLEPFAKSSGRITSANHRKQWEGLIHAAGYNSQRPWVADCMRHTAASMLLAIKRNRALVAEELGTSTEILRRFYRQPILSSEAQRFWALNPSSSATV
jgi:integrase